LKSASLTAQRAFQLNNSSADACRVLATIAERDQQPTAVDWRKQVMGIVPNSAPDAIALARCALQFDKTDLAESTLAKIGPDAEQMPAYHEVQAQLAIAKKDPATAERHFSEAVKLDPSNKLYQLDLAVAQLQSTSDQTRAHATEELQGLLNDESLRLSAARALRNYAAQQKRVTMLLDIAERLSKFPEANFRDRLSHVQILRLFNQPEFAEELAKLQSEASSDPAKLTDLLGWMNSNQLSVFAIDWIKRLPPETINGRGVSLTVADSYINVRDWDGLADWCKKTDWGDFEFLRHGYLARALREKKDDLGFKSQWETAVKSASNSDRLYLLERCAGTWGWKKETEDLLWTLSKDPQKQDSVLSALYQLYLTNRDTENLYRVVARLCDVKPDDKLAQNNFAQLSLLLNLNVGRAREIATQLYQNDPKNPVFASTYAFSLFRDKRYQQALDVMNQLPSDDLRRPEIAAYYGIFLAGIGDAKARDFLDLGRQAPLLPEEKSLLEKAQSGIKAN
jgi:predicted Zn-dependent protease